MVETANFGYMYIHLWEWLTLPIYFLIILGFGYRFKRKKIKEEPVYRFYLPGLFIKLCGSIFFTLIYIYYYSYGDTFGYFETSQVMQNLMFQSPEGWALNEFTKASPEHISLFNDATGYPTYYYDRSTFMVVRLLNPLLLLTFSSYILTSLLIAWIAYSGIWRLFLVFSDTYPDRQRMLAFAILFFPSVLFWGSGILKDTITFSCTGWIVFCMYNIFIKRKKAIRYFILLFILLYLIFIIKSYIIIALVPGSLMWIFSDRITRIKNAGLKFLVGPFIVLICVGGGLLIYSLLKNYIGKFSFGSLVMTAKIKQHDLKQEYYHGHSFDIGEIEATPTGILKKSPAALIAGIYRPFLWECNTPVTILSGLENAVILAASILAFLRTGPFRLIIRLFREPLLFFAFTYSLFFAFSVGLSTSNFGALVRFKIAYISFFMAVLFILWTKKEPEPKKVIITNSR